MDAAAAPPPNLDFLLDVPVKLTVKIGSCQMPMREVLQLTTGSVIQLDQPADSKVDLYVNQKWLARGEVVVVEDQLGVKVTELNNRPT